MRTLTLIIETIYTIDAGTLVIASKQEKVLRILDLVGQQQTDSLQRLLSSVYIVAQKEVICFGRKATILKQPKQIGVLTVNIT